MSRKGRADVKSYEYITYKFYKNAEEYYLRKEKDNLHDLRLSQESISWDGLMMTTTALLMDGETG